MKWMKAYILPLATSSLALLSLSGCAPLVAAGAGGGAVGANMAGNSIPVKTQVSDVQIKFKAIDLLKDYPALKNNSNVEIVVFNQIVLLLGQVPNEEIKTDLANKIANLAGVRMVYNQLVVGPTVSIGTYASDSLITTSVISKLIANGINSLKYKVVTEEGIVYMMGVVTKQEGQAASLIASRVSGVNKVIEAYSIIEAPSSATTDTNSNKTDTSEENQQLTVSNSKHPIEQQNAIGPTEPSV